MPKSAAVPLRRSTRSKTARYWGDKVSKSDKVSESDKVSKSDKVSESDKVSQSDKVSESDKVSQSDKVSKSDKVISTCGSTTTSKVMTTPETPERNSDSPSIISSKTSIEQEESTAATLSQGSVTKPLPPKDTETEEDMMIKEDTRRVLLSRLPSNISVIRFRVADPSPRMSGSVMKDQDDNDTSGLRVDVNSATSLPVEGQEKSMMEAQTVKQSHDKETSNNVSKGLSPSISIIRSPTPSAAHRLSGSGIQVQDDFKCGGKELVDLTGCEDDAVDDQIYIVEELEQKELKVEKEVKVENKNVGMGEHEQGMVGHRGKASHKMAGGMRLAGGHVRGGMRQLSPSPGSCVWGPGKGGVHARFGGGGYYDSFRGGKAGGGAMAGRGRARMMLPGNSVIPKLRAQQHLPFTPPARLSTPARLATPARHMTPPARLATPARHMTPPARLATPARHMTPPARLATPATVSFAVTTAGKQVRIELNKKQTEALRRSLNE